MSQTVPTQHPAVVLRSHYRNLKGLLVVALIAIVSLSATLVMLAREDDGAGTTPVSYVNPVDPVNYGSGEGVATAKPDESKVAAAISARQAQQEMGRPDESRIATAISAPSEQNTGGPDESGIAAALGAR